MAIHTMKVTGGKSNEWHVTLHFKSPEVQWEVYMQLVEKGYKVERNPPIESFHNASEAVRHVERLLTTDP